MGLLPNDADLLPASDDRVFKLLLTSPEAEPVLIELASLIINRPVVSVFVRNNEIPVGDVDEKAERLDINCRTDDDTQIDIEMQASRIVEDSDGEHRNLKGKSIYYLCDLHSSQPSKGVKRYDMLARTYQVTFCSYTIFPHRTEYINSYSLRHDEDNELLTDAIKVVYIELSKLDEIVKKSVSDMTDMEKWSIFFSYSNIPKYRETVNKIIESKEVFKVAGSLLMNISQDEKERAVFRSRRMYNTDMESNLATAKDIGIKEGRQEGIQQGRIEEKVETAKNMLADGESIEKIVKYTKLTLEEIEDLQKSLQT